VCAANAAPKGLEMPVAQYRLCVGEREDVIATRRLPSAHMLSRTGWEVLAGPTSIDLFAGIRGQSLGFQYGIAPAAGFEFENLSPLYRPVCAEAQRKTSPGYIRGALPYFRRSA
jgi:hypothetical protein